MLTFASLSLSSLSSSTSTLLSRIDDHESAHSNYVPICRCKAAVFTKIQVQLLAIQLESCRVEFLAQRHFVAELTALFCRVVSAFVFKEIYSDTGVGLRLFDTIRISSAIRHERNHVNSNCFRLMQAVRTARTFSKANNTKLLISHNDWRESTLKRHRRHNRHLAFACCNRHASTNVNARRQARVNGAKIIRNTY